MKKLVFIQKKLNNYEIKKILIKEKNEGSTEI